MQSIGMRAICSYVRRKFPKVSQMTTAYLQSEIDSGKDILILDTRPLEEFEVSHLQSSQRIDFNVESEVPRMLAQVESQKPNFVVCYCSVGYRSSMFADRLKKAGCSVDVYNLEGSIFKWANENRGLIDKLGAVTSFAHPYSKGWDLLLDSSKRKWTQT